MKFISSSLFTTMHSLVYWLNCNVIHFEFILYLHPPSKSKIYNATQRPFPTGRGWLHVWNLHIVMASFDSTLKYFSFIHSLIQCLWRRMDSGFQFCLNWSINVSSIFVFTRFILCCLFQVNIRKSAVFWNVFDIFQPINVSSIFLLQIKALLRK